MFTQNLSLKFFFFVYLAVYFFIPIAGYFFFFGDEISGTFPEISDLQPSKVFLILLIICLLFFALNYFSKWKYFKLPLLRFLYLKQIYFVALMIFVPISIYYFMQFGVSYRHTGDSISESGPIPILTIFIKSYLIFGVFIYKKSFLKKISLPLTATMIMTFSRSIDVLFILAPLMILAEDSKKNFSYTIILLPLIGMLVVYGGLLTKTGLNFADFVERTNNILYVFTWRFGVHFFSTYLIIENYYDWIFNKSIQNVIYEFDNFLFRLSVIFQIDYAKPDLNNLARMNAEQLFGAVGLRTVTGAGAGILGTFLTSQPLFIYQFTYIFFTGYLLRALNYLSENSIKLSTFALFPIFLLVIEGQYILLNPVSAKFLIVFFLISAYEYKKAINLRN